MLKQCQRFLSAIGSSSFQGKFFNGVLFEQALGQVDIVRR